jgi:hypothetical protein
MHEALDWRRVLAEDDKSGDDEDPSGHDGHDQPDNADKDQSDAGPDPQNLPQTVILITL